MQYQGPCSNNSEFKSSNEAATAANNETPRKDGTCFEIHPDLHPDQFSTNKSESGCGNNESNHNAVYANVTRTDAYVKLQKQQLLQLVAIAMDHLELRLPLFVILIAEIGLQELKLLLMVLRIATFLFISLFVINIEIFRV
jgi:hypothetical protein